MTKEEQMLLKHFYDLSERAYHQSRPCFSDFLDMNEQSLLLQYFQGPVHPTLYGGYDFAERKIAVFSELPVRYPLCWLEIRPVYPKYSEELGHRDFLGSILGLGLERNCIGDLLIENSTARILCLERVKGFLLQELTQVRHTMVQAQEIELPEVLARPKFDILHGTVSSLRLDAVISLAFHLSRSQSCSLIESGQVYINSRMNTSNGAVLKDGDMISVRHKGKFIFVDSKNKSKKNKCMVEIHKYV
ncbi:YlmH/Sll1252 family protein [Frisingicoccus sp.]|uniref:YlmH/Sll1252 family protein n=1 Tax=Frisingicoccus sp. TaxID=1918627 RepID=UPI00305DBABB